MQNYIQFEITSIPFNIDLLSGALWELEILGLNENDNYITVSVYENSKVTEARIKDQLNNLIKENLIKSYTVKENVLENRNWNEEWEKKINVIEVSDRIVIKPSFRDFKAKENQIVIIIDPKMSFGTGEHQTTRLMLQLLEKHLQIGDKVLDVGSGTSVLGIAASKLGADKVISVDNDEWCYINSKENVERNNVLNIDVKHGTIQDVEETEFDLVLANINRNVLMEIKQNLFNKIKRSKLLILSGILEEDLEEIKRQYAQMGLTALEYKQLDEWIVIVFKKV